MRLIFGFLLFAFGLVQANITERTESRFLKSRIKIRIDEGWKIASGTQAGAEAMTFNDAGWTTINVPHDMSISLVKSGTNDPAALGWYRKHFTLPPEFAGKKVVVQLDGVYHDSKVYLNGNLVGSQRYGYVSLSYDLTSHLNATGDNVLAVFVDNQTSRRSRWYSGTGIFRHVWLIASNKVSVKNWGTFVTTPTATTAQSQINIQTEIMNDLGTAQIRDVETILYDEAGIALESVISPITVKAAGMDTCIQTITLASPKLWSPATPVLYYAYTRVLENKVLTDDYVTPFGIRDLKFEANKGFSINGVIMKLKGVNIHSTLIPVGAAVPEAMWERTIRQLQAAGCNFIRTSHNPFSPEFLELCDKMGMLILDEWCDKWSRTTAGNFYIDWDKYWKQDLESFMIRDRNHPSVIMWDVGNEVDQSEMIPTYIYDNLKVIVPQLKLYDNTRKVTHACVAGWGGDWAGFAKLADYEDIIGVNYQDWGYPSIHTKVPNALILGTEQYPYLSGGMPTWPAVKNNAYVIGHTLWTGMDYLGEGGNLGSASGFIDNCAFRKTWFYYQKSQWTDAPMVKIGIGDAVLSSSNAWASPNLSESWNRTEASVNVVIYSNCESVDLYVNSTKIGSKNLSSAANKILQFANVSYEAGMIRVVGIKGGQAVAFDTIQTVGAPAKIVLKTDRTNLYADGDDVSNIEAYVSDAEGRHVWSATNSIEYTITGKGRSLGIASGDWKSSEYFKTTSRKAYQGRVLIPVQATMEPGSITVTISSAGLTSGILTLTTIAQTPGTVLHARPLIAPSGRLGNFSCLRDARSRNIRIQYSVKDPGVVQLLVLSPMGKTLAVLNDGYRAAGNYSVEWKGGSQNDVYLVALKMGLDNKVQKVFAGR
jgi:beta-galactosidase